MGNVTKTNITDAVREAAYRLTGAAEDYDPLMDLMGDARFVLLGEASHGTHEFYEQRAEITKLQGSSIRPIRHNHSPG